MRTSMWGKKYVCLAKMWGKKVCVLAKKNIMCAVCALVVC